MSDYIRTDKQILVAAFGITSSLLTAIALALIEFYTGYALYSWMFWFVIPLGACLSGFAAASGYYAGAKICHQKPVGGVLFNMICASVSAYFVVNYLPYYLLEIEGVRVKDVIPFLQYLDYSITSTSLSFLRGGSTTGELGNFGYVYAFIQLIGFSAGGFAVFVWLEKNPYCEKCSRYLFKSWDQEVYTSEGDKLIENIKRFTDLLGVKKFNEAIKWHGQDMGESETAGHHLKAKIEVRECSMCGINHLSFVASKLNKNSWEEISETEIGVFTSEELSLQ